MRHVQATAVVLLCAVLGAAAPPKPAAEKVTVSVGELSRVEVTPDAAGVVGWASGAGDADMFVDELAPRGGKTRLLVQAKKAGTYRVMRRSLNVVPCLPSHDVKHTGSTNAIAGSQSRDADHAFFVLGTDLTNQFFIDDGEWVPSAEQQCALCKTVPGIGFASIPSQIGDAVIRRVSVRSVARNHARRTRANKSLQDQPVNGACASLQPHLQVPVLIADPRGELPPHLGDFAPASSYEAAVTTHDSVFQTCPHAAVVADSVAGQSVDVAVRDRRIGLSHCHLPEGGKGQGRRVLPAPVRPDHILLHIAAHLQSQRGM